VTNTSQRHAGIVYGPVASRRFGLSLGINLSGPGKFCSFDCLYCFRGRNDGRPRQAAYLRGVPSVAEVLSAVESYVAESDTTAIEDWALAGNAEPTDNPELPEILEGLVRLRDRVSPRVRVTVLSNGMGLVPRLNPGHEAVKRALGLADCPCLKLDAARPDTWLRLARAMLGVRLPEWLEAVEGTPRLTLQTMFVKGVVDNTTDDELAALRAAYTRLAPSKIYLLTINKPPAGLHVEAVPGEEMAVIGSQLDIGVTRVCVA
jgi:wyosine [tRNA(Phe)-imidazoG37] synthetase (radical SAM superfamily)